VSSEEPRTQRPVVAVRSDFGVNTPHDVDLYGSQYAACGEPSST